MLYILPTIAEIINVITADDAFLVTVYASFCQPATQCLRLFTSLHNFGARFFLVFFIAFDIFIINVY